MVFLDISPIRSEHVKWRGRLVVIDYWTRAGWRRLPVRPRHAMVVGPFVVSVCCKEREGGP